MIFGSPVWKVSCQKAAMCAEKLNKKTTANYDRNLENKINPIFEIDNEDFHSFD